MRSILTVLFIIFFLSCSEPQTVPSNKITLTYSTQLSPGKVRKDGVMPPEGKDYFSKISSCISGKWKPGFLPNEYRATVLMVIEKNGNLHALKIEKTSGDPDFDKSVLAIIQSCAPFPEAPASFEIAPIIIHYSFTYPRN